MRGKGWLPSPAAAPHRFGAGIHYALGVMPPAHALAVPGGLPLDQGATSSCVAHALVGCLRILTGQPLASRRLVYGLARAADGEPVGGLTDDGCMPSDAVAAVSEHGVCLESDLPWDESQINAPPTWSALRVASAYRLTGWERLPDSGRLDAIRRALVAGHPLMFGMSVDSAYESLAGSAVYPGATGPSLGGHMQIVCGYDDAIQAVRVLGSWGAEFADGGSAWIAYDWIQRPECSDFYALDAAPNGIT